MTLEESFSQTHKAVLFNAIVMHPTNTKLLRFCLFELYIIHCFVITMHILHLSFEVLNTDLPGDNRHSIFTHHIEPSKMVDKSR